MGDRFDGLSPPFVHFNTLRFLRSKLYIYSRKSYHSNIFRKNAPTTASTHRHTNEQRANFQILGWNTKNPPTPSIWPAKHEGMRSRRATIEDKSKARSRPQGGN